MMMRTVPEERSLDRGLHIPGLDLSIVAAMICKRSPSPPLVGSAFDRRILRIKVLTHNQAAPNQHHLRSQVTGQSEHLVHINSKSPFVTPSSIVLFHQLALGVSLFSVAIKPPVDSPDVWNRRHPELADEASAQQVIVLPGIGRS
jgi:hypothetical protein